MVMGPVIMVAGGGASASGHTISTSSDGITWNGLGKTVFSSTCNGVAYANGLWVAAGQGINTIAYSNNGNTWTGLGTTYLNNYGWCVAYGKDASGVGLWVVGGNSTNGNTMATSYDGSVWRGYDVSGVFSVIWGLTYGIDNSGVGVWVATGVKSISGLGSYPVVASSPNGITWTPQTNTFMDAGNGATYGKDASGQSLWIAVGTKFYGTNYTIMSSKNGKTWLGVNNTIFSGYSGGRKGCVGAAYGNDASGAGLWIAVGNAGKNIATSPNGNTWTSKTTPGFNFAGYSVAYGQDNLENWIWLAGGDGGTAGNVMIKSTDGGNTWVGRSITGMTQILCIAFKSSLV
jgi:hypothetical protein